MDLAEHSTTEPVWERQPGEPGLWHARFEIYRLLGPARSLDAAYRRSAEQEGLEGKRPGSHWRQVAKEWSWQERAEAWDAAERVRLRALEETRRFDARENRLRMIARLLAAVYAVLQVADLSELSLEEARRMLPTLRILFKDLLTAQRLELGLPLFEERYGAGDIFFTADDLIEAQRELERWSMEQERVRHLDDMSLLVVVGPDPALNIDLAMLRAVSSETGLAIKVLPDATKDALDRHLQRVRALERPVRWMQMSCHMTPDYVELADGVVDGNWLSQRLMGVEILVLAGCSASDVGDWLAVVPYVITFGAGVEHRAAAWFVKAFWTEIAEGRGVDLALVNALEKSPPVMWEWVEKHW